MWLTGSTIARSKTLDGVFVLNPALFDFFENRFESLKRWGVPVAHVEIPREEIVEIVNILDAELTRQQQAKGVETS
jgi:hypothetical protein